MGKNKMGRLSQIDQFFERLHSFLFVKHCSANIIVSVSFYIITVLLFGESLSISNNYFVIIPVITLAGVYGFWGGLISGILALPANLLLFYLIGHPEFSPDSKIIAEASGIIIGSALGYTNDYFYKLRMEIARRKASEKQLQQTVEDKEIMLKELHHRVKNNINLIKSMIQLQSYRINDEATKEECEKLNHRIISIGLVQDLLYSEDFSEFVLLNNYMEKLIHNLSLWGHDSLSPIVLNLPENNILVESKKITSLGLILNEAITNSLKYAGLENRAVIITVNLSIEGNRADLTIEDNGPGFPEEFLTKNGLGMKLMDSLSTQIKARFSFSNNPGALVRLNFPVQIESNL